jgi:hypothetical protein
MLQTKTLIKNLVSLYLAKTMSNVMTERLQNPSQGNWENSRSWLTSNLCNGLRQLDWADLCNG